MLSFQVRSRLLSRGLRPVRSVQSQLLPPGASPGHLRGADGGGGAKDQGRNRKGRQEVMCSFNAEADLCEANIFFIMYYY